MELTTFISLEVAVFAFTTLFFFARVYFDLRRYITSQLSTGSLISLLFAVFAWLCYTTLFGVTLWRNNKILLNMPHQDEFLFIKPLGVVYSQAVIVLKVTLSENYTAPFGAWAVKASFLAFYFTLRARLPQRMKIVLYSAVAYCVLTFLAAIGMTSFWCRPFETHWSLNPNETCTELLFIEYIAIYTALNVTSDLLVIAVPALLIHSLRLEHRDKWGILFLIFLGLLTVTATISRSVVIASMNASLASFDPRVEQVATAELLSNCELAAALVAGSLPSLKAVIWRASRKRTLQGKLGSSLMLTPKGTAVPRGKTARGSGASEAPILKEVGLMGTGGLGTGDEEMGIVRTVSVEVTTQSEPARSTVSFNQPMVGVAF